MKKTIISLILVLALTLSTSVVAFAAYSKVNSAYIPERGATYESTITQTCSTIKAYGKYYDVYTPNTVYIRVYYKTLFGGEKKVAEKSIGLNGQVFTLDNLVESFEPRTYYVQVSSDRADPYEVTTIFYE